jgi:tripartite-type tricarboxylate transporter receptor subunit TctC
VTRKKTSLSRKVGAANVWRQWHSVCPGRAVNVLRGFFGSDQRMRVCRVPVLTCAVVIAALVTATSSTAQPSSYPSRSIELVVPSTPGTGADVLARLLDDTLAATLDTSVVVENKAGASGAIGTEFVAHAKPDGHTLLVTATSHGTVPAFKAKLPYDPVTSFAPVALLATSTMAIVVTPELPVKTLAEFIALAKEQPGKLYYSSPGSGSIQHMAMELVKLDTGIDLVHVPYKGTAGAVSDVVGGHVQASVVALQTVATFAKSGRVRMLAVLSYARSPAFPDVPTLREIGYSNLVVDTWYGVFAPAGTAPAIVARLNAAFNAALDAPQIRQSLAQQGMTAVVDQPERLRALLQSELTRWTRLVREARITAD